MGRKLAAIKRIVSEEHSFEAVLDEFQTQNRIKNLSVHTVKSYQSNIKPFQNFLANHAISNMEDITKKDFDKFILWLQETRDNASTINSYLRAARALLYFAMNNNYMQPFKVNLIKDERKIKEVYNDADILKLIAKPKNIKKCSFSEYRNWVLANYFVETGNRLSTVINIKVADVDLHSSMVILRATKNKRQMYYPVSNKLMPILQEYIKTWGLKGEDYLFPNFEREQLSRNAIRKAVTSYNQARGVDITSIHCFRHTFAKNFVLTNGDSLILQRLLGHSSLTVTQNYVNLFDDEIGKDFERHSILERLTQNRIKREK